ncbi:MAG TPA: VOC family protein [Candidatus Polarisedimenticolaceae bacterium]|nr:VOC family protein [Candidatus Polarisedimenticolaceae bacterium]
MTGRSRHSGILAVAIAFTLSLVHAAESSAPVRAVESVGLTVADLERSVRFFTEVLDFERIARAELDGEAFEAQTGVFGSRARVERLALGREHVELTEYLAPAGRPLPADSRGNDRWFQHIAIIVSDMDAAYAKLREHGVRHLSPGPQTLPSWNPRAGGIRAFYFKDPDGHALELLWFPPGKGNVRWQRADGKLFLGIDHTAIVVADTESSVRFYRDVLGLREEGRGENYGPEQERLNNVFGARLRITTLRAADGPGIELLEYLSPPDGRPYPADARANDLVHWETVLDVADPAAVAVELQGAGGKWVSSGVVPGAAESPFSESLLARDPTGHALRLVRRRAEPAR